jgi:hypothetical protein
VGEQKTASSQDQTVTTPCTLQRYFRLPIEEIAYVRFVVEAYEGLAQVTSLPGRAEMEWRIPEGLIAAAEELAGALAVEVGLAPIPRPPDWPED